MAVQRLAAQQHGLERRSGAQPRPGARIGDDQVAGGDVDVVQLRVAFQDVERTFDVAVVQHQLGIGVQVDGDIEGVGEHLHRRLLAIGAAGDHPQPGAVAVLLRQAGGGVVVEGRIGFLVRPGQGHPGLHAVGQAAGGAFGRRGALGVGDAAAGGHPVDVAGPDHLVGAQGVAVADRPVPEEGHRGQADVRMRTHVQATAGLEYHWPHVVDEHERADAARLQGGDGAADPEAVAQVMLAWRDDRGHGVLRGGSRREARRSARRVGSGSR